MNRSELTVLSVINQCNLNKLNYCVARNHDKYPYVENDLDLFFADSVTSFREILVNAANYYDWDYLIESKKWRTDFKEANVHVFIFINKNNFDRLQIDLFSGFSIYGAPLIDSKKLVEGSIYSSEKKCYVINREFEKIIHIFQIASLLGDSSPRAGAKITKYRYKVLNNKNEIPQLIDFSNKLRLNSFPEVLSNLEKENYKIFRLRVIFAKIKFLIQKIIGNPIYILRGFASRINYYFDCFYNPYCIFVHANSNDFYTLALSARQMEEAHFIQNFVKLRSWLDWIRKIKKIIRVLERGGVIICESKKSHLDPMDFKQNLIDEIIKRDVILWSKW